MLILFGISDSLSDLGLVQNFLKLIRMAGMYNSTTVLNSLVTVTQPIDS